MTFLSPYNNFDSHDQMLTFVSGLNSQNLLRYLESAPDLLSIEARKTFLSALKITI